MCIDPHAEICCHGQCNHGRDCPLWGRASQKVVQLRGRETSSPLIQSQRPAVVTDEQARAMDDTLDAFGPAPSNTTGSLVLDVLWMWLPRLFWDRIYPAMPVRLRMALSRPWFVREQTQARRRADVHPGNVTHIDHYQQYLKSQELLQRLQGQKKESK